MVVVGDELVRGDCGEVLNAGVIRMGGDKSGCHDPLPGEERRATCLGAVVDLFLFLLHQNVTESHIFISNCGRI